MIGNEARISVRLPVCQRNRGLIGGYHLKLLLHDWRRLVEDKSLAENSMVESTLSLTHLDATVWRLTLPNPEENVLLKLTNLGIRSEGSKDELHFPP